MFKTYRWYKCSHNGIQCDISWRRFTVKSKTLSKYAANCGHLNASL